MIIPRKKRTTGKWFSMAWVENEFWYQIWKVSGGVVLIFFAQFLGNHPWIHPGSPVWMVALQSQHQRCLKGTSTPREGPFCGAQVTSGLYFASIYIYIYSTWLGLFKSSSLAHRPWGVRLVDSGEAKSFRSIKQTSTRKYSTNDPWRMMKLYLFHEISHGHQKWMLWNRASFLQLKQFWRVSGLWNKILVGFQEIVNFHYTGTTAQS